MFLIILLYLFCAASFTISKAVLDYGAPFFFVGVRMVAAGTLLLGYSLYKKNLVPIARKDFVNFFYIIFVHIYIVYMSDLWALQYMSSAKSSFIYNLSPFVAALFSYFYFSENMTPKKWLGLTIGFASSIPELYYSSPGDIDIAQCGFISWPEFFMIVSTVASVWGWVLLRDLVKDHAYEPSFVNGVGMFFGGILALITSFFVETWWIRSPVWDVKNFALLTAAIVITCNLIYYNMYGLLLRKYTATFLSFAGFLTPIIVAILGMVFLHEKVSGVFFVSVFAVAIGLYIFYQEELRQGYIEQ